MVLLLRRITEKVVGHAEQTQSRARAERGCNSCLNWLSRYSPESEQREINGLAWEWLVGTGPHWKTPFIQFGSKFQLKKNTHLREHKYKRWIMYYFICLKWLLTNFIPVHDPSQSIQSRARNLPLLLLWRNFALQRNISLLPLWNVFARQEPLLGQVLLYWYKTTTPNPVLVIPECLTDPV